MTDELLFERLASHDGPAAMDSAFEARLYAVLEREQRGGRSLRPALLLAATLMLVLAITAAIAVGSGFIKPPWLDRLLFPGPSPTSPSLLATPTESPSASLLPGLGMPGTRSSPAGEYGWTCCRTGPNWMHNVVGSGQTQLQFAVKDDCFVGEGPEPIAVTVAGLDALYVEPYADPDSVFFFGGYRGVETTGAYAIAIGDRTLCVYLTWDPETTPEELSAARQVVESIRGQPWGEDRIRIIFTLAAGWDTG
jgi:hypothetical protein